MEKKKMLGYVECQGVFKVLITILTVKEMVVRAVFLHFSIFQQQKNYF